MLVMIIFSTHRFKMAQCCKKFEIVWNEAEVLGGISQHSIGSASPCECSKPLAGTPMPDFVFQTVCQVRDPKGKVPKEPRAQRLAAGCHG